MFFGIKISDPTICMKCVVLLSELSLIIKTFEAELPWDLAVVGNYAG